MDIVVRPEDIKVVKPEEGMLKGVVKSALFKGVHYEMIVEAADGFNWKIHSTQITEPGSEIGMNIAPFDIQIMKIPYNILTGWLYEDSFVDIGPVKVKYLPENSNASDFEYEETVTVYILPQDIEVLEKEPENFEEEGSNYLSGEVLTFRYKGDDYEITVRSGDITVLVHTYTKLTVGETVYLHIPEDKIRIRRREEVATIDEESN